jgi:hypothetical protein
VVGVKGREKRVWIKREHLDKIVLMLVSNEFQGVLIFGSGVRIKL